MKINRIELKKALEIVKPGLANKEVIEQSTSFAFINDKIATYNDEISVSHPLNIGFTGAIQADELYKYVSKLKDDEIDLSITDTEVIIKAGRSMAGFVLLTEVKLPLEEELAEKGKFVSLPENFLPLLKFAAQCTSKNQYDAKLTCVNIDTEKGFVEGCDNYRILHCNIKPIPKVKSFLIPFTSANIISQFAPVKVAEGKAWVHFKTAEGSVISCRTFNEKYVDTSSFIKEPKDTNEIPIPTTLSEILERAIIFAKRDTVAEEAIEVFINQKKLIVKSQSENGRFEESAPIKFSGEPFSFKITPYLLKDITNQTKSFSFFGKGLFFKGEDWVYFTTIRQ